MANDAVPDNEVLDFATQSGRAILTHNRPDFMALHRKNKTHEGIIVCTVNPDFSALAACIHKRLLELDSVRGLFVRVNKGG
jgi:predicted nuclease of predicted toxin-antitoxin system